MLTGLVMKKNRDFDFKKAQIETFVKAEYAKKFRRTARISIRKRQKFMDEMTRKIGKKFGKDVLCLVDFTKGGFVTLISPAHTESTDFGKLYNSFTHQQVCYTSHCLDRFSQRTENEDNCVIMLDAYMNDALLTFGENEGHLACPAGVFAYDVDGGRLIVKTYINFDLLSEEQLLKFYGPGTATMLPEECLAEDEDQTDFMLCDEHPDPPVKPKY